MAFPLVLFFFKLHHHATCANNLKKYWLFLSFYIFVVTLSGSVRLKGFFFPTKEPVSSSSIKLLTNVRWNPNKGYYTHRCNCLVILFDFCFTVSTPVLSYRITRWNDLFEHALQLPWKWPPGPPFRPV